MQEWGLLTEHKYACDSAKLAHPSGPRVPCELALFLYNLGHFGGHTFENIDRRKLQTLQDILNELNLNSEEGIRRVPSMTGAIAKLLADRLGCKTAG